MLQPLNILMVNWTWYGHGGDWTYIENLKKLYEDHGHNVLPFSMKSPKNVDAKGFDKYFVEHIDYKELNKQKNIINGFRAVSRTIYSQEAKRNLGQLLAHHKVDVAHLHNINHYITPSILPLLKKHNIPVLWTLHDYTLLCPENSFISNDRICENCKGGKFFHCAVQKCKKNSLLASSLASLENYVHRYMHVFDQVDYFLCPSAFLYNKFMEFNFFPQKLVLTNLCFDIGIMPGPKEPEDYILYVGRLEKYKGVITLLKAMDGINIPLYVAGSGTEAENIRSYITEHKLTNVILMGHQPKEKVHQLIQKARFVICPSEWYENFPFSVIESMSMKTAVIGSAIGGIPELVIHEQTGLLYEPFSAADLQKNILRLLYDPALQRTLGENASVHAASIVSFNRHYQTLKDVFYRLNLNL